MSACPEELFDFRQPDYAAIFRARSERLARIKANPGRLPALRAHYKDHIADFISDWGMTFDPRNPEIGLPATVPFVLFPQQRAWVEWILNRWRSREDGLTEKSRDSGVSWLAIAAACSLCLFNEGLVIGFGSRKEEYVDKLGQPKSLFEKARIFLGMLPREFRAGWERDKHSPYMRILFPGTGSCLTGEAGDSIGRGDRTSIYFLDEAAFLERPALVEAALSATSNCRIYISTPNGSANPFAEKRFSGKVKFFTFHWRKDPRKGEEWYARECAKLIDPVIIAQELDIDYMASVEGVVIPQAWVQAAIGAHEKLGIEASGARRAALDVADEGRDANAFVAGYGLEVIHCEAWSGKGSDLFDTTERAFLLCDEHKIDSLTYDADGLGAGVRGDAKRIQARRQQERVFRKVAVTDYRGSGAVFDPEGTVPGTDRKSIDLYQNLKAQSWFHARRLFQETFRAVQGAAQYDRNLIISLSPDIPNLQKLCTELSQAQWKMSATGKIMIDKAPEGRASPNLADALVMLVAPKLRPMRISDTALDMGQEVY